MIVPGSNVLNSALRVISKQCFQYYAFLSRTPNSIGQDVAAFAAPVTLRGSVQPVPRSMYQTFGLDFQRYYINVYVSRQILDIARDVSGDQIGFEGKMFQCVSKTPWHGIDGWDAILCVQII